MITQVIKEMKLFCFLSLNQITIVICNINSEETHFFLLKLG